MVPHGSGADDEAQIGKSRRATGMSGDGSFAFDVAARSPRRDVHPASQGRGGRVFEDGRLFLHCDSEQERRTVRHLRNKVQTRDRIIGLGILPSQDKGAQPGLGRDTGWIRG